MARDWRPSPPRSLQELYDRLLRFVEGEPEWKPQLGVELASGAQYINHGHRTTPRACWIQVRDSGAINVGVELTGDYAILTASAACTVDLLFLL